MSIHRWPLGDLERSGSVESGQRPSLAKGTVLRTRYRVTGTRATRHLATVYDAEDIVTARSVAVTVLHEIGQDERARVDKFRRTSARVAATRASPPRSFVMVEDCDLTEDGQLFLVTERVEGRSLQDLLDAPEKDYVQALELLMRAGEALTWVLDVGFVEIRMAPTDIVYVGDNKVAKVIGTEALALRELGLAKRLARTWSSDPDYAWSPEEREGYPATERSAVYRFGALLRLIVGSRQCEAAAGGTRRQRRLPAPFFRSSAWYSRDPWGALEHLAARLTDPDPLVRPTDLRPILDELFEAACRLQFGGRDAREASEETLWPWREIGRARAGNAATSRVAWVAIPLLIVTMALIASISVGIGRRQPVAPVSLEAARPAAPTAPSASLPPPEASSRRPASPPTTVRPKRSPPSSDAIARPRAIPDTARSPVASDVPTRAAAGAIAPTPSLSMPPAVGTIEPSRPPAPSVLDVIEPPPRRPTPPGTERQQAADPGAIIDWLIERRYSAPE